MLVDRRVCLRRMAFIWFSVSPWVGLMTVLSKLSLLLSISAAVAATFRLVDTPMLLLAVVVFLFSSRCILLTKSRLTIFAQLPFESFSFIVSTFCEIFCTRSLSFVVWPFAFSASNRMKWMCHLGVFSIDPSPEIYCLLPFTYLWMYFEGRSRCWTWEAHAV